MLFLNSYIGFSQDKTDSFFQHIVKNKEVIYSASIVDTIGVGSTDILITCSDTSGNSKWANTFGSPNLELVSGILLVDSNLFIYGTTRSPTIGLDNFFITQLDLNGNLLDYLILGTTSHDKFKNLIQIQSNKLLFIGTTLLGTIISEIDYQDTLKVDTSILIKSNFNNHLESIVKLDNGDFILTGYSDSTNGARKDIICIALDSNYNLKWSYSYNDGANQQASKIVIDDNDNIYIGGNTLLNGATQPLVIKLNSNGGVIWQKSFGTFLNEKIYTLKYHGGLVYCGGYTQSATGSFDDAFILSIDTNSSIIKKFKIDLPNDEYLTQIEFEDKNKITLSGPFKDVSASSWSYFSIDVDSNFNSCYTTYWNIDSLDHLFIKNNFIVTLDTINLSIDSILFTYQSENVDLNYLLCNIIFSDSIIDTTGINISKLKSNLLKLYPNPFEESIYAIDNVQNLIIYDVTGDEIFQKQSLLKNETLLLSHLQKGIYIFSYKHKNKYKFQKIVKY